jgi:hypothetical protein
MKATSAFQTILAKMPKVSKPVKNFLSELLVVFLSLKGRYCFRNISRWSSFCAHTVSRNFAKGFDFYLFEQQFLDTFLQGKKLIAVVDCSFVTKAGKASFGLDTFFSSTIGKAVKGLELSLIALVDILCRKLGFTSAINKGSFQPRRTADKGRFRGRRKPGGLLS